MQADIWHRHLVPPSLQQRGVLGAVANSQSADEDPPRRLAHHRIPHGRGVARALYPEPRALGQAVRGRDARVDELTLRGYATALHVDEEDAHRFAA